MSERERASDLHGNHPCNHEDPAAKQSCIVRTNDSGNHMIKTLLKKWPNEIPISNE